MAIGFRNYIGFICSLLFLCLSSSSAVSAADKLSVWGSDNYPPFEYINESGEPEGFNVDIIRALMSELGYEYELKLGNWAEVVQNIQDRNIDIVIGMIYSPKRASNIRFTLPLCSINRNLITRKSDDFKSLSELEGKEVIVEKGGWFHRYLLENNFNVKIIESGDIYQSVRLLSSGKYDAILTSELVSQYAIKQLKIKNLTTRSLNIDSQSYAIAVNQDRDDLLYQLNIGLQRLKLSGTYDQIYNKWFGIYEEQQSYRIFFIALVIFISLALLLISFVWLLRKKVAQATRLLNYTKQEVGIAVDAGNISAWTYMIQERTIKALHGKSLGGEGTPIEKIYETIHPDDIKLVREEFEALANGTKCATAVSFRIREGKDLDYGYAETKMVRVEATKELPCRIVGTLKNVTEDILIRNKLEEYRLNSEFIIKTNGIILIQYSIESQTFTRLSDDQSKKSMCYTLEQYFAMVYPEDFSIAIQFVAELNKAEKKKIDTEFRVISDNGIYNWYIISAVAYKYNDQGKIISYMGLRRDNSKWKVINNDLILLREKAEESNRLKSAFLANMSHEIRTPLNAIVGFSELIIDMDDKEEKAKFIEIVKTNNELLLQLVNDVLDLSRIEAGYINFSFDTFDFAEYFQEMAMSLKIKAPQEVVLNYINRCTDLNICSDRNRISQVITNFVTNAFKFTNRGSVTLDYVLEDGGIKVSVTDTGIGIASENVSRIFDRFVKVNDFAQGTGLGLSICKVIIEALQGKIGVESQPGIGSIFWFWIPCNLGVDAQQLENVARNLSAVELSSVRPNSTESNLPESKKTILIAEDVDNNYLIICTIIKDSYRIIRAKNGIDAIEKAKQSNPDIILMDMKMPLMGGLEATREIRKFNSTVPIIALTAYVFDTNRQDAICAGCNDFLTKPVNRNVLMQALNNCI